MIKQKIRALVLDSIKALGFPSDTNFEILTPKPGFGDFSSNAALILAKQQGTSPREMADALLEAITKHTPSAIDRIEIAGPGFINFFLAESFYTDITARILGAGDTWGSNQELTGKKIMIEYTDPNPFKPFHIGHLMTNAIGESLSRIVEASGAHLVRANYQGDVGLHVAKAIWALGGEGLPDKSLPVQEQAEYIGRCYVLGSRAYEDNLEAKAEIDVINKKVYTREDEVINEIYDWGREITLEAFEAIYKKLGTHFNYYFFESEMAIIGEKIVRANIGKVFTESNGAIVFHGENYDPKLHTRVFISSQGLPTYEGKELGLVMTKFEKENPDVSITVTANEQAEYMRVVTKAVEQLEPSIAPRMHHICHGMMRLEAGKMSSRKGNVVTGESLLKDSYEEVYEKVLERDYSQELKESIATTVSVAALKYSILKPAMGGDITFDFERSISFEGDSGPYLQYAAIRARSILNKAAEAGLAPSADSRKGHEVTPLERELFRFEDVVFRAGKEYEPHHIVTFLTDLSAAFNQFYGAGQIVDAANLAAPYKLALTHAFYITLNNGLKLLGISLPEKM
ncbi:MAG TPA: arginine--tRNA ligase [Patescibacteria group bacterium]|nr:arginine--tRNA ligase [Patescibacteria group bacterium]